jgi:hypothetical protein
VSRTRRHAPLEGKLTSSLAPVGATSSLAPVGATSSSLVGTGVTRPVMGVSYTPITSSSLPTSDGIESESCAVEHQWEHVSRMSRTRQRTCGGETHIIVGAGGTCAGGVRHFGRSESAQRTARSHAASLLLGHGRERAVHTTPDNTTGRHGDALLQTTRSSAAPPARQEPRTSRPSHPHTSLSSQAHPTSRTPCLARKIRRGRARGRTNVRSHLASSFRALGTLGPSLFPADSPPSTSHRW